MTTTHCALCNEPLKSKEDGMCAECKEKWEQALDERTYDDS